jgi:hypothetical protein
VEEYLYWKRITKYNPSYRNEQGAYVRPEWTAISDIGKVFGEEELTREEYLRIEARYAQAAQWLFAGSEQIALVELSSGWDNGPDPHIEPTLHHTWQALREGATLTSFEVAQVVKLFLREHARGYLVDSTQRLKLDFGYDYYMYVNYEVMPAETFTRIEGLGLFIE